MSSALVLFAQGSEELETISIVNILRRGGIQVTLAGLHDGALCGSRGIVLLPDTTLQAVLDDDFDMLVLPGGQPGTNHLKADARVVHLVQRMNAKARYIAAICAAPSILAAAGILSGKRATCFPTCLDAYPEVRLQTEAVVEDGKIITSRGPGTAIDFALVLLERLAGSTSRAQVEASLQR